MSRFNFVLCALALTATSVLSAQSSSSSLNLVDPGSAAGSAAVRPGTLAPKSAAMGKPFTHMALGAGISPLGVNLSAATNLTRHLNLRANGNVFNYNINNLSTNGFTVNGKLNLASAGASLDYYPWARHGFRVSPGLLFYNKNGANATFTAQSGTSFSLNDYTYYPSATNPVVGVGKFGLNKRNPAFTATTGWGNMIPRSGHHLSFPFEIGAAFVGAPSVDLNLVSGDVCDGQGQNCVDVTTDPTVQSNLQAQVAKYRSDAEALQVYPIVSFGVTYSFRVRRSTY